MVGFPLLLIPLAVYNIIVFLMPGVSFTDVLVKVPMIAGTEWPVTLGDVLLAFGIVLLLLEVVKGARPGAKFLMDHLLSLVVFGAAAAEFVMWPKFGTSIFFLLTLLAMADFFGGIAQRTRRRAVAVDAAPVSRKSWRKTSWRKADELADQPPAESKFEPVVVVPAAPAPQPAPSAPAPSASAQSVAESVLKDHPAPPSQTPEVSPQLQPSNTTPGSPEQPR